MKVFNNVQQIYDLCDGNAKKIMLYFRDEDTYKLLVSETSNIETDNKSIRYYCWLHKITTLPLCPFCGKPLAWFDMKHGFRETCGDNECIQKYRKIKKPLKEKETINSVSELWDKCNHSSKGIMVSFRNEDNYSLLVKETSWMPSDVSKSERFYCWVNKLTEIPKCPYCGKFRRFEGMTEGYFPTCGSKQCRSAGIAAGNRSEKRNFSEQVRKMKETYKERTGYEHNMQNPEFKKQYFEDYKKKHNGELCGVTSKLAIENRKKIFDEKYNGNIRSALTEGAIRKFGSLSNMAKLNNRNIGEEKREKSNAELMMRIEQMGYTFVNFVSENILTIRCNRCSSEFDISRQSINVHYRNKDFEFCHKCDYKQMTFRSKFEEDLLDYVKSIYEGDIETNVKYRFDGMECDIFIPELKIGIEANGVYWHTEQYKEKNSHIEKKKKLHEKGCSLIQIWDDDWNDINKREIIFSRLAEKMGVNSKIYARKCEYIEDIDDSTSKKFLEDNHLQGYVHSKYRCGLYYDGVLVMLMTVGKRRKMIGQNDDSLELLRLCTLKGISVVGGFSKLLSHFRKSHVGEKMISYADCDWCDFDNNGYSSVGFDFVRQTVPDYYWCYREKRENRMNYTKQKLVAAGYDSSKTEVEIMHELGYYRLFGSGNFLYEIIL